MTDTDKYEGTWKIHGMEYWKYSYKGQCEADTNLIHDAPLLLEEVKELQTWKKLVSDIVQQHDGSQLREMLKELIE